VKITELQKKCQKDPKTPIKIKAECELLDAINALQEDQATKNDQIDALIAELQAKDTALMDKDMELMDTDSLLAETDTTTQTELEDTKSELADALEAIAIMCQNNVHIKDASTSFVWFFVYVNQVFVVLSDVDIELGVELPQVSVDVIKGVSYSTRVVDPCDEFNSIEDLIGWNPDCEIRIIKGVNHSTQEIVLLEPMHPYTVYPFAFLDDSIEYLKVLNAAKELNDVEMCDGYTDTSESLVELLV